MQTSKFLLAMGALATVILPLQVQAGPDTPEQAKMREVLRRMMEQPKAAETVAPPATPAPAKPVVVTPPPPAPKPVAAPVAPVTPVAPPPVVTPAAAVAVQAASVAVAKPTFETVPPPDDAASIARAREAMRQKMLELQATPAPAPTATVATTPVAPAPTVAPTPVAPIAVATPPSRPTTAPVFATTYAPIQAPDSPLSSSKQAKLAELLVLYKADSITAQEYHKQRAAILAGP